MGWGAMPDSIPLAIAYLSGVASVWLVAALIPPRRRRGLAPPPGTLTRPDFHGGYQPCPWAGRLNPPPFEP
jgi:hypothetical protein